MIHPISGIVESTVMRLVVAPVLVLALVSVLVITAVCRSVPPEDSPAAGAYAILSWLFVYQSTGLSMEKF